MKRFLFIIGLCSAAAGCTASRNELYGREDAPRVIPEMRKAALEKNQADVPRLVKQLESDDAAIRFYAIQSLQRISGDSFGYVYYAESDAREASVSRWKEWLASQQGGSISTPLGIPTATAIKEPEVLPAPGTVGAPQR